jgi:hypothetical protein
VFQHWEPVIIKCEDISAFIDYNIPELIPQSESITEALAS